jgi:microcystin-dependent protein
MHDEKARLEALHAAARTVRTLARSEMMARAKAKRAQALATTAEASHIEAVAEHDAAREALELAQHELRVAHEACCGAGACRGHETMPPAPATVN